MLKPNHIHRRRYAAQYTPNTVTGTPELPNVSPLVQWLIGCFLHSMLPLAQPPAPEWRLAERFRRVLTALPTLALETALHDELQTSLEHPAWRAAACLVHGDAGAHNLLWDGQITALFDWEWSGWGNPLLDLAWVYWTMRWRNVPDQLWPIFLAGYGHTPPGTIDGGGLRALALGQIAGLLVRVHDQPDAWAEWLRRARWTIALPFPA